MGFKIVQMEGNALLQGEIITKEPKYTDFFFKKSSPEPTSQFQ
jgi:hypothetical protein